MIKQIILLLITFTTTQAVYQRERPEDVNRKLNHLQMVHNKKSAGLGVDPTAWYSAPTAKDSAPTERYSAPPARNNAPTARNNAPIASYSSPTARYSAQTARYSAQTARHSAPTAWYSASTVKSSVPTASYSALTAKYSAPTARYSAPIAKYNAPIARHSTPTAWYSAPTAKSRAPTARYSAPTAKYWTRQIPRSSKKNVNHISEKNKQQNPETKRGTVSSQGNMSKQNILRGLLEKLNISIPCNKPDSQSSSLSLPSRETSPTILESDQVDDSLNIGEIKKRRKTQVPSSIPFTGSLSHQVKKDRGSHKGQDTYTHQISQPSPMYENFDGKRMLQSENLERPTHEKESLYERMIRHMFRARNGGNNRVHNSHDTRLKSQRSYFKDGERKFDIGFGNSNVPNDDVRHQKSPENSKSARSFSLFPGIGQMHSEFPRNNFLNYFAKGHKLSLNKTGTSEKETNGQSSLTRTGSTKTPLKQNFDHAQSMGKLPKGSKVKQEQTNEDIDKMATSEDNSEQLRVDDVINSTSLDKKNTSTGNITIKKPKISYEKKDNETPVYLREREEEDTPVYREKGPVIKLKMRSPTGTMDTTILPSKHNTHKTNILDKRETGRDEPTINKPTPSVLFSRSPTSYHSKKRQSVSHEGKLKERQFVEIIDNASHSNSSNALTSNATIVLANKMAGVTEPVRVDERVNKSGNQHFGSDSQSMSGDKKLSFLLSSFREKEQAHFRTVPYREMPESLNKFNSPNDANVNSSFLTQIRNLKDSRLMNSSLSGAVMSELDSFNVSIGGNSAIITNVSSFTKKPLIGNANKTEHETFKTLDGSVNQNSSETPDLENHSRLYIEREFGKKELNISADYFDKEISGVLLTYEANNGRESSNSERNVSMAFDSVVDRRDSDLATFLNNSQISGKTKPEGTNHKQKVTKDRNQLSYKNTKPVIKRVFETNVTRKSILPTPTTLYKTDGRQTTTPLLSLKTEGEMNVKEIKQDTKAKNRHSSHVKQPVDVDQTGPSLQTINADGVFNTSVENLNQTADNSLSLKDSSRNVSTNLNLIGQTYITAFVNFLRKMFGNGQNSFLTNNNTHERNKFLKGSDLFHLSGLNKSTYHLEKNDTSLLQQHHNLYNGGSGNTIVFVNTTHYNQPTNDSTLNERETVPRYLKEDLASHFVTSDALGTESQSAKAEQTNVNKESNTTSMDHNVYSKSISVVKKPIQALLASVSENLTAQSLGRNTQNITTEIIYKNDVGTNSSTTAIIDRQENYEPLIKQLRSTSGVGLYDIFINSNTNRSQEIKNSRQNGSKDLETVESNFYNRNSATLKPRTETLIRNKTSAFTNILPQPNKTNSKFTASNLAMAGYTSLYESINSSSLSAVVDNATIMDKIMSLNDNEPRSQLRIPHISIYIKPRQKITHIVAKYNSSHSLEQEVIQEKNATNLTQVNKNNTTNSTLHFAIDVPQGKDVEKVNVSIVSLSDSVSELQNPKAYGVDVLNGTNQTYEAEVTLKRNATFSVTQDEDRFSNLLQGQNFTLPHDSTGNDSLPTETEWYHSVKPKSKFLDPISGSETLSNDTVRNVSEIQTTKVNLTTDKEVSLTQMTEIVLPNSSIIERDSSLSDHKKNIGSTDANHENITSTDENQENITSTDENQENITSTDANQENITSTDANQENITSTDENQENITSTDENQENMTSTDANQENMVYAQNNRNSLTKALNGTSTLITNQSFNTQPEYSNETANQDFVRSATEQYLNNSFHNDASGPNGSNETESAVTKYTQTVPASSSEYVAKESSGGGTENVTVEVTTLPVHINETTSMSYPDSLFAETNINSSYPKRENKNTSSDVKHKSANQLSSSSLNPIEVLVPHIDSTSVDYLKNAVEYDKVNESSETPKVKITSNSSVTRNKLDDQIVSTDYNTIELKHSQSNDSNDDISHFQTTENLLINETILLQKNDLAQSNTSVSINVTTISGDLNNILVTRLDAKNKTAIDLGVEEAPILVDEMLTSLLFAFKVKSPSAHNGASISDKKESTLPAGNDLGFKYSDSKVDLSSKRHETSKLQLAESLQNSVEETSNIPSGSKVKTPLILNETTKSEINGSIKSNSTKNEIMSPDLQAEVKDIKSETTGLNDTRILQSEGKDTTNGQKTDFHDTYFNQTESTQSPNSDVTNSSSERHGFRTEFSKENTSSFETESASIPSLETTTFILPVHFEEMEFTDAPSLDNTTFIIQEKETTNGSLIDTVSFKKNKSELSFNHEKAFATDAEDRYAVDKSFDTELLEMLKPESSNKELKSKDFDSSGVLKGNAHFQTYPRENNVNITDGDESNLIRNNRTISQSDFKEVERCKGSCLNHTTLNQSTEIEPSITPMFSLSKGLNASDIKPYSDNTDSSQLAAQIQNLFRNRTESRIGDIEENTMFNFTTTSLKSNDGNASKSIKHMNQSAKIKSYLPKNINIKNLSTIDNFQNNTERNHASFINRSIQNHDITVDQRSSDEYSYTNSNFPSNHTISGKSLNYAINHQRYNNHSNFATLEIKRNVSSHDRLGHHEAYLSNVNDYHKKTNKDKYIQHLPSESATYFMQAVFYPLYHTEVGSHPNFENLTPASLSSSLVPQNTALEGSLGPLTQHLLAPVLNAILRHHSMLHSNSLINGLHLNNTDSLHGSDMNEVYDHILNANTASRQTLFTLENIQPITNNLDSVNRGTMSDIMNSRPDSFDEYETSLKKANANYDIDQPPMKENDTNAHAVNRSVSSPDRTIRITELEPSQLSLLWMARPWPNLRRNQGRLNSKAIPSFIRPTLRKNFFGLLTELLPNDITTRQDDTRGSPQGYTSHGFIGSPNTIPRYLLDWRDILSPMVQERTNLRKSYKRQQKEPQKILDDNNKVGEDYLNHLRSILEPETVENLFTDLTRDSSLPESDSTDFSRQKIYVETRDSNSNPNSGEYGEDLLAPAFSFPGVHAKPNLPKDPETGKRINFYSPNEFQNKGTPDMNQYNSEYAPFSQYFRNRRYNSIELQNKGKPDMTEYPPFSRYLQNHRYNPLASQGRAKPRFIFESNNRQATLQSLTPSRMSQVGYETPIDKSLTRPFWRRREAGGSSVVDRTRPYNNYMLMPRVGQTSSSTGLAWSKLFSQSRGIPASTEFQCKQLFGHFAHPFDCQSFYACSWGVAYRFRCPRGSLFNRLEGICDWSAKVTCRLNHMLMPGNSW